MILNKILTGLIMIPGLLVLSVLAESLTEDILIDRYSKDLTIIIKY